MKPAKNHLSGLVKRLTDSRLLSAQVISRTLQEARRNKVSFITQLHRQHLVSPELLIRAIAQEYSLPIFDLNPVNLDALPTKLIEPQLLHKHQALPLRQRGKHLLVGVSDPSNQQNLDDIQFHTALNVSPVLVQEDQLQEALDSLLHPNVTKTASNTPLAEVITLASNTESDVDDAPVVRYVNQVLQDAINASASDIHFEPYENHYRIRFRLDGILHDQPSPEPDIASRLASRLKVMAQLNIAEKRVPQDGRIRLSASKNRAIDFRINTCPTLYGEKVVLRILDSTTTRLNIHELGMETQQQALFLQAINKPQGIILVTGPTGSGKTVTLYTALNRLNKAEVNISTVEDPVEIQVAGINQVNINTKTGLTFAEALRAFLRQDPDIMMVGEIRDLETAEIAIKAAQTGHLVMSTLHTNDASQTLMRLNYMGVPAFNIASSIHLIIAQRLARRLCDHCKQIDKLGAEALREEGFTDTDLQSGITIYRANGCAACTNGYKGRIGLFEVMPVSDAMGRLIVDGADAIQIRDQASKEGVLSLRNAGLNKVKAGLTSLAEINRVTKE